VRATGGQLLTGGFWLAILGFTVSGLLSPHGIAHLLRLRADRQELGERAVALVQQNQALRTEIKRLESDRLYLEGLARRELGLVRPNETVYRFHRLPDPPS
jgi:cell division protein FtsB